MYKNINGSFIYFINYQDNERELCKMEMRCLFNREINEKYFFSDIDINASKSPFIKSKIKILRNDTVLDILIILILIIVIMYSFNINVFSEIWG